MNITKVTLNKKQWQSFCKILQGLARQCYDADIIDGVIRQRANDTSAIFEVNMTSMLDSLTFPICPIKDNLGLLKDLVGPVTIERGQNKVVFSDDLSCYNMPPANKNHLDNKFMSEQELDPILQSHAQRTTPLIIHTIEKTNLKRIHMALATFHAKSYKVVFESRTAFLCLEQGDTTSKGSRLSMELIRNLPLSKPITGHMYLPASPYNSFDYDGNIVWEIYKTENWILSKHYWSIGDVTALIYTRGKINNGPPKTPQQSEETTKTGLETPKVKGETSFG